MKKIALIAALGCSSLMSFAQDLRNQQPHGTPYFHPRMTASPAPASMMNEGGPEGTTATPFWTENFSSGTPTTIPTGWTAAAATGVSGTWKWRNVATTSQFNIGVINSTTASNGWMVYDSDSIGALNSASPISGTLTSPVINCTGHSTVQLSFQQWFRRFVDTCYVDVSNNGGGTWTRFAVQPNNTIGNNISLPSNPYINYINISSVAANQANVRIRFYYICTDVDGGYNWLVDDVALAELDPVELGVDNSAWVMRLGAGRGFTSFGQYPRQLVDSVYPIGFATNFGSAAQATANYNARIFRGATQVYNQSLVYNTPLNAVDSAVDFTDRPGYLPTDTGLHTVVISINQTGDAITSNNTDSAQFRITDSVLSMNVGVRSGTSYYVQRPSTHSAGLGFNHVGVWIDIPEGKSDTISAVQVAVSTGTTVGATIQAQVYKFDGTDYQPYCETVLRTLTAANISTTASLVLITLPIDLTSSMNQMVLDSGNYAVVVRGVGNDDDSTILIPGFQSPASRLGNAFQYGTISESDNSSQSYTYGVDGPFFLPDFTPVVRPVFGRRPTQAVKDVRVATLGAAYPNPANTKVSIPVTLAQASEVSVTLTNAQGQVIARQELGKQAAGRSLEITFPTGSLTSGVYFYTVEWDPLESTCRHASLSIL